jgi:hypothetical protein
MYTCIEEKHGHIRGDTGRIHGRRREGESRHAGTIRLPKRADPCRIHRLPSVALRLSPARSPDLNRYVCVQQHVEVTQVDACMHACMI